MRSSLRQTVVAPAPSLSPGGTGSWGGGQIDDYLLPPKLPKKYEIAFINSNCGGGGAHARTAYVKELMKHIQIDSMGPCLHNKDLPKAHSQSRLPVLCRKQLTLRV